MLVTPRSPSPRPTPPRSLSPPSPQFIIPPLLATRRVNYAADYWRRNTILESEQDSQFWFDDGNVLIQLGSKNYAQIHRSVLKLHSTHFNETLDDTAHSFLKNYEPRLDDGDFRMLLKLLYPRTFVAKEEDSTEEWSAILRAATRLRFDSIRELAIEKLTGKVCPVEGIVLGRGFDVPQWLEASYISVCEREESLTEEEGKKLGLEDVIRVMRAREAVHIRSRDVVDTVRDIFGLEAPIADEMGGSREPIMGISTTSPSRDIVSSPVQETPVADSSLVTPIPILWSDSGTPTEIAMLGDMPAGKPTTVKKKKKKKVGSNSGTIGSVPTSSWAVNPPSEPTTFSADDLSVTYPSLQLQ